MASGSAPSIKEDPRACVAHAWGSEALYDLPDLKYSSYYTKMKKVETRQGLPRSHDGNGQPFPVWSLGQLAASVALTKLLAMHILRSHPQLTQSATPGKGAASGRLVTALQAFGSYVTGASAKHSWLETSASLEREMRS